MASAFIRSVLSWQQAMIGSASYPCPSSIIALVDLEEAAVDAAAAQKWVSFLTFMAGNFEKIISEAVPACDDHRIELQKLNNVLSAIRDAHAHARAHVASLDVSTARSAPLAFVQSLVRWQWAMGGAVAHPVSYALVAEVDLEQAADDPETAQEWVTFLGSVAQKLTDVLERAPSDGAKCPLVNAENMLARVREAMAAAEKHVRSLRAARAFVDMPEHT
jgi:hypothetical protein